jgi:hypothetical protein
METASFRCPECGRAYPVDIPERKCLEFIKCRYCDALIEAPQGQCCVICAFTDSRCPVSIAGEKERVIRRTRWPVE